MAYLQIDRDMSTDRSSSSSPAVVRGHAEPVKVQIQPRDYALDHADYNRCHSATWATVDHKKSGIDDLSALKDLDRQVRNDLPDLCDV